MADERTVLHWSQCAIPVTGSTRTRDVTVDEAHAHTYGHMLEYYSAMNMRIFYYL